MRSGPNLWWHLPCAIALAFTILPVGARAVELQLPSLDKPDSSEVFAGNPRTSTYPEIPWVYWWEEGECYPVPFHIVRFALRIEDRSANQLVHRQVRGGPYEVLGHETPNKVFVWLPAGFDPVAAYYDTWEYIQDPAGLAHDAISTAIDFKQRDVQILTTEELYQVKIFPELILRMNRALEDMGRALGVPAPSTSGDLPDAP